MFTPKERGTLRTELLAHARNDPRITGAAVTGSASVAAEDRWSDIDVAFGVREPVATHDVLHDFSHYMRKAES